MLNTNLLRKATLDNVVKIEEKISKALVKFSEQYECSLNELYIRIVGNDNDFPTYSVYKNAEKLADVELSEVVMLNQLEQLVVSKESVRESIYRNLDKFLIGFKETKLSELQIIICTKTEDLKPLFFLYKGSQQHKQIKSHQII